MHSFRVDTVVFYDDTRAADDFTRISILVNLAETSPSSEEFCVGNLYRGWISARRRVYHASDLDEVDLVVGTEGLNELDVLCLCVCLYENAKMCLTLVEGLCAFTKTTGEAIVLERGLENLL